MKNFKYILISFGFIFLFYLIKDIKLIRLKNKYSQWETTGFKGKTENGLKQGEWTNFFINGKVAEIKNYLNDTLNGEDISYTPFGEQNAYSKYRMGIKVDTSKFYSGGKLNVIEFRDSQGLLQGEFRVYAGDTISQIGYYLNDQFHGKITNYEYKTGRIKEINEYTNGKKSGKWIYFNSKGDTIKTENYD